LLQLLHCANSFIFSCSKKKKNSFIFWWWWVYA